MPTPYIKQVASQHELSVKTVESIWNKSKKITKKFLRVSSPSYWGTVTNIFKSRLQKFLQTRKRSE